MAKILYKYEASSNKFVWFTTWDRALRNFYTDDYNYVPDPVVDNPFNTFVEFRSRSPVWLMWIGGDGIKEQFPMTKVQGEDNYRIIFRSLAIQHRKNPNTTWWFRKEDGSQYVPVDNHAYADGKRNQFYSLSVSMYNAVYPTENQRPSGTEQAPEGFVKGQSNGSPATPMEKIYVLKNNYAQRWTIKPA